MNDMSRMTWTDVEDATGTGAVLLVPMGSTEQHGPHLPLTTDTDIALAIVGHPSVGRHLPDAVIAPAVGYGSSGEHDGFPGTLSIGQSVTESLVVELARSAIAPFDRVVIVSTHGGNSEPLARAVSRLRSEGRDVRSWSPRWPGDAHAGRIETSLMLAIAPGRVRLDSAASGDLRSIASLLPDLRSGGVRSVSPNGVLGDPTKATPEEGFRLLDAAARELVAFVGRPRGTELVP
ncbi:MAG: mycofactocin biosynthesis peptidyl-dipeptidase MftE [Acidimicrobiales bacterium]